jgi:hypothetical protein
VSRLPKALLAALLCAALCGAVVFASSAFGAAPAVTIEAANPVGYVTAGVAGTVDPGGEPTTYRFQYISEAAFQANLTSSLPGFEGAATGPEVGGFEGSGPQPVSGELTGLAANTTYHLRLIAENGSGPAEATPPTFTTKAVAKPVVGIPTASGVTGTTASLAGTVEVTNADPAFDASCAFEYATAADFSNAAAIACEPATVLGSESQPVPVTASLTNLFPGATYHLRLRATNAGGATATEAAGTFTTSAVAPTILSTSASEVGSTSAVLRGTFNPGGAEATYHFEYLTEAQFEAGGESFAGAISTPTSAPITTALNASHQAEAVISGLATETPYRYRLVLTNPQSPAGGTAGPTRSLATQTQGQAESQVCGNASSRTGASSGLPDCRAFELVTPPGGEETEVYSMVLGSIQGNAQFGSEAYLPFQSSLDGNAVTYAGEPTNSGNGSVSTGGARGNQFLATHSSDGWTPENISISPPYFRGNYDDFSSDLSAGVFQAGGFFGEPTTPLLPTAPSGNLKVLYARDSGTGAERPLFTEAPPGISRFEFTSEFTGGSSDFSTMVYDAVGETGAGLGNNVYETTDGSAPQLVNLLPGSDAIEPSAVTGAPNVSGEEGFPDYNNAVSTDGSRIYWTGLASDGLYLREDGTRTIQVDASEVPGGHGGGGLYWTATPDGSQVFFTDDASAELTSDTVAGSGVNLYRYDVEASLGRHLTDLTASAHADVRGVIGASADGSYVYYVANGVLANNSGAQEGTASPGSCELPSEEFNEGPGLSNHCNLYVEHQGARTYVASLTGQDGRGMHPMYEGSRSGLSGDWVQGLAKRTSAVAGQGADLVFASTRMLTDYDNEGLTEAYVYSPRSSELTCVSCDPSGASPRLNYAGNQGATGVAGILPPSGSELNGGHNINQVRTTRWISEDGDRVFFDSLVPLLPQDTNRFIDVYEWERDGSGSCVRPSGCLSLLSGGKSKNNSYLLDADAEGKNVFFVTNESLVPEDHGGAVDVYDARVEGERPPIPALQCEGESCRTKPPAPPAAESAGTSTFSGPVNPAPATKCKKGFVKKHGKCVKQKSKKGKDKKHKQSNKKRGNGKKQKRAGHKQGGGK